MKKKILILVCVISLITTVGAFAALHISEEVKFNKMSKFDQMVTVMNKSIEDNVEFNSALINYKYLEYGYKVSNDNMDYFSDLIIDGYNAEKVMRCAYFWLDTAEDASIVKKMCDWREKNQDYNEDFWTEYVFNAVTNNSCGVLTVEDFDEYNEKGITDSQIVIANRLCRKGVYTIQQILSKVEKGESLTDIALEIEEKVQGTKRAEVVSEYSALAKKYPKVQETELFESRKLAMLKNVPEQMFYDTTGSATNIKDEVESASKIVIDEIINELNEGNYLRTGRKVAEKDE